VNLVVTNVPGSPVPLYLLGARLHESVPIVPLAGNLDVSIGVLSYERDIAIGLFADVTTCPDVNVIAEGIEKSFVDLQEAEVTRT
jgi:diacylglycerol O-acyltransferase / wax synthase